MAESLALFRKNRAEDMAKLAEKHVQHDLTDSDRTTLESAARSVSTHTTIGSVIGLTLGFLLAYRLRLSRTTFYRAVRAVERPTHVRFADGREEAIPDLTPLMRPTALGDVATYAFFGLGGMMVGGEVGLLSGGWRARAKIEGDGETKRRIEKAWRAWRADVLKREVEELQRGGGERDGEGESGMGLLSDGKGW